MSCTAFKGVSGGCASELKVGISEADVVGGAGDEVDASRRRLSHPPERISVDSGSADASFGLLSGVGLCASASVASEGGELALAEAGVTSTGDERGHDSCAAAAAEGSVSGLAAPARPGSTSRTLGTLLDVDAAAFVGPKAGAREAGRIVPSEPLLNWF